MATEMPNCHELILEDVVGISLCLFGNTTFSRPQNVPSIDILSFGQYSVMARFHLSDSDATFRLSQQPVISLTTLRTEQGLIYSHEVSISVTDGFSEAENVVSQLQHNDFAIIYHKADGSHSLSLPLPNTASVLIEESVGSGASATIKAKMQSVSGLIRLTFANG